MPEWAPTKNENPRLGSKQETIGDQREPTHWEFFGEGPGTVFLQKKGVPGAFTYKIHCDREGALCAAKLALTPARFSISQREIAMPAFAESS
jgi:hypothetical protein